MDYSILRSLHNATDSRSLTAIEIIDIYQSHTALFGNSFRVPYSERAVDPPAPRLQRCFKVDLLSCVSVPRRQKVQLALEKIAVMASQISSVQYMTDSSARMGFRSIGICKPDLRGAKTFNLRL